MDKTNPRHILLLMISTFFLFLSIPLRKLKSRDKKRIVFYYQMHGNSKALAEALQKKFPQYELLYLAYPKYRKIYSSQHALKTLNPLNFFDMVKAAQSDVVVTNYEAHNLVYFAKYTDIKFVDVWHGLPMLKNQTPKILNYLNYYTEVWVSSPAMKDFYEKFYKLKSKVVVTGYGRTDKLVNNSYKNVRKKYNLPNKKIILIAPTWKHGDPDRSIYPFGLDEEEFLNKVDDLAGNMDAKVIMRAHMLSSSSGDKAKYKNIIQMSVKDYPDSEELLSISDIVATDWSSIVFDYLALNKPVIFFDTKAPFTGRDIKMRSSKQNRFGEIIKEFDEFSGYVKEYLNNPGKFNAKHSKELKKIKEIAYGRYLDGKATDRYLQRMAEILDTV